MSDDLESYTISLIGVLFTTLSIVYFRHKTAKVRQIVVDEIWIYPIKSCRGIKLNHSIITRTGFQFDREFMLIDKNNKFLSQRTFPSMTLIKTDISINKRYLIVSYSNMPDLNIPLSNDIFQSNKRIDVNVWGDNCTGVYCGDEISAWFCKVLQTDGLKLLRFDNTSIRKTEEEYAPNGQTAFSDGYPFLLLSQESIEDINKRSNSQVYHIENFRPNIIVKGCQYGFEEDTWKDINFISNTNTVNNIRREEDHDSQIKTDKGIQENSCSMTMTIVKPCARCKIPSVDIHTGIMDPNNNITKLLKTFRTGEKIGYPRPKWAKEVFVGQNLDHGGSDQGNILHVGDEVRILSYRKFHEFS